MGNGKLSFRMTCPVILFGNIEIIARISEHDEYGTLEISEKIKWGTLVPIEIQKNKRALWGRPPIWIIVAVTTAFAAAWIHYLMAIYSLLKVRKG